MKDDQPPRIVSSSAWTGPPPEAHHRGAHRRFQPPSDPVEQRRQTVAWWLFGGCFLAFLAWYAVLGYHSPVAPSLETGHTEALKMFSRRGPPIYVRPAEALITYALLAATLVVPVAYLEWGSLRRRFKR